MMDELVAETGKSRSFWTIQQEDRDPFRMDKDANHRDCGWVREAWDSRGIRIPLHPRGIPYSLIGEPMPPGIKQNKEFLAKYPGDRRYEVYDNTVWPADWRALAPHELTGRLPKAHGPTCGRRATSSGKPCMVRVPMYGDACSTHAAIDAERSQSL